MSQLNLWRRDPSPPRAWPAFCVLALSAIGLASPPIPFTGTLHAQSVDPLVSSIADAVVRYYSRAQSVVARQTMTIQPLGVDMMPAGFARRLVYEVRIEWNPAEPSPANVVRELVSAYGPNLGPPDDPQCLDPKAVLPEPLAFLLPDRRHRFRFVSGRGRLDGRAAVWIDFKPVAAEPPRVDWRSKHCGSIDLPGRTAGRVWADAETMEIMRFDEHVVGRVDIPLPRERWRPNGPTFFTVERADTSIRYRPVRFSDPDETIVLPSEVQEVSIIRSSGMPRVRTTQTFTDYRRFVTGSRILP